VDFSVVSTISEFEYSTKVSLSTPKYKFHVNRTMKILQNSFHIISGISSQISQDTKRVNTIISMITKNKGEISTRKTSSY